MKPSQRVCAHVKRGICDACAKPLVPPKCEKRHYVTAFGHALLAAGNGKLPRRPNHRSTHRNHNHKSNG